MTTMHEVPDLASYDAILVSSSAGKDSQAMIDYVVELAGLQAVPLSRLTVVHADLGRVEWKGTVELAREQAEHYGLRFIVTSRIGGVSKKDGKTYSKGETFGDILDYAERRGRWPDSGNRWCTSDFKRGPIRRVITQLHREHGARQPFRLLSCMGMRAEESPRRAKMAPLVSGAAPGKVGGSECCTQKRHVDTWLPIQSWTEAQVWERIRRSGVRHHPAYDAGMPRLSCCFCIFAPKPALMIAGKLNPELLDAYVGAEARMGHTFRNGFSLAEIKAAIEAGEETDAGDLSGAWNM